MRQALAELVAFIPGLILVIALLGLRQLVAERRASMLLAIPAVAVAVWAATRANPSLELLVGAHLVAALLGGAALRPLGERARIVVLIVISVVVTATSRRAFRSSSRASSGCAEPTQRPPASTGRTAAKMVSAISTWPGAVG